MARGDRFFADLESSVARELKDFRGKVLKDCCEKDCGPFAQSISISAFFKKAACAADWEDESCF